MNHVDIGAALPANHRALFALSAEARTAAADAGLDPLVGELVKIRASQLNGCAYCLRMHVRDAAQLGETADRLAVVAAWWESQYFTEVEQAALAVAERLTRVDGGAVHSTVVPEDVLDEAQLAAVSWLTVVINAWNRVALASHYPVAA